MRPNYEECRKPWTGLGGGTTPSNPPSPQVHLWLQPMICSSGASLEEAMRLYGEYFYHYAMKKGFGGMLHSLGRDFESFLQNLDFHHYFTSTFVYGSLKAPSFRVERVADDRLMLYYYSMRKKQQLHWLVIGAFMSCKIFPADFNFWAMYRVGQREPYTFELS